MKRSTVCNSIEGQTNAKNTDFCNTSIQKSAGSRLYDDKGHAYIDLSSQTPYNLLGHNISEIQEGIKTHLSKSQETSSLPYENQMTQNLCERIQQELPTKEQWNIEFLESDTNAIDKALLTAFQYWHSKRETDREMILTFAHAHHGSILSSMNFNASFDNHNHFQNFLIPTEYIPYPSTWHLDNKVDLKEKLALDRLEEILKENHTKCAALIMEPLLQSKNGMQACRPSFINKVIETVKKYNLLTISDERYLSPARSGRFFASQFLNTTPDMIIIGNGLTNNVVPMGTLITTDKIQAQLLKSEIPNTSKNINRIACIAASKTIDILQKKLNIPHVNKLQETHMKRLNRLHKQPIVEHIRYLGSIGAFDIICEDRSKQKPLIEWIYSNCTKRNLLIQKHDKSICLSPPLCLSIKDLNQCYDLIEDIMQNIPLKYITSCIST